MKPGASISCSNFLVRFLRLWNARAKHFVSDKCDVDSSVRVHFPSIDRFTGRDKHWIHTNLCKPSERVHPKGGFCETSPKNRIEYRMYL